MYVQLAKNIIDMTDGEVKIIKTLTDKVKELEALEASKKIVDDKNDALNTKMHAELKVIRDKYKEELGGYETEIKDFQGKISVTTKEKNALVIEENWQEALSRGEINEFYLMSMIKRCEIDSYGKDIKHKQTLKNNIEVWMIIDDTSNAYKFYLAFYKGALVGTSFRYTAAHAGDDTYPYSFIGQFDDYIKNPEPKSWFDNASFTFWMRELKKLDLDEATLLPMNADTLDIIKEGVKDKWNYYGWKRNDKKEA